MVNNSAAKKKREYDVIKLFDAVESGDLWRLQHLVEEKGLSVNMKHTSRGTPLHDAASDGNLDVVKYLLDHGAIIDAKDDKDNTPLHNAARCGHLDMVEYLVENGASVNAENAWYNTPLYLSIVNSFDMIKYFVDHGANIDAKNMDGRTPLHSAASIHDLNAVKYLIDNGATVDVRDNDGKTPLNEAAEEDYMDVVMYLLDNGALTNALEITFFDPLDEINYHNLVKYSERNADTFDQLSKLKTKAQVQLLDGTVESWSVLDYAVFMGEVDLVWELLFRMKNILRTKFTLLVLKAKKYQELRK